MNPVRQIRDWAGLTQAELAAAAGTSQPTIASYESGTKSLTLRTLERLAAATGAEVVIDVVAPMTREDRRSLFLHRAIARRLLAAPEATLARARRNVRKMAATQPGAAPLLNEWRRILKRPAREIAEVITDPRQHPRDLRQVTPFAGVFTAQDRAALYREFRKREQRR